MANPTPFEALCSVLAAFKTQTAMADALGVSQPTVWRWLNQSRRVPAEYVLAIEAATGISRHELRPDIYPIKRQRRSTAGRGAAA
jgi:DNA-binding transcriptional regulator YdaS (Cro superfamily)